MSLAGSLRQRLVRPAVLTAALVLAAACATEPGPVTPPDRTPAAPQVDVDVSSPELRAQRQQAGIEPCPTPDAPPLDDEDALPTVVLPCLGGGPSVDLNQLRGPLVINLFAQWCGPCREELPYYQRLHEESPGGVRVLGIDWQDTQPAGALTLAADAGVRFPLLADPAGELRDDFRIRGLPGAVFVDRQGRVTEVVFTVIDAYPELTALVERHLGIPADPE